MRRVKEVIIVEGRYDKNTVAQAINGTIIETAGFGIFSNTDKLALFRRLAQTRGLIILTDSDRAGFFIRGRLRGILGEANVKHAYIPDVPGKERRKASASKEGKLGGEGMEVEVIIKSLEVAGATFDDSSNAVRDKSESISMADMYEAGLTGMSCSAQKRRSLLVKLGLPTKLSTKAMLDVLNVLMTREEFLSENFIQK